MPGAPARQLRVSHSIDFLKDKIDEVYAARPILPEMEPASPRAAWSRTEGGLPASRRRLQRHGRTGPTSSPLNAWTYMYHRGQIWYWRRPGKDSGEHSATTGRKGFDCRRTGCTSFRRHRLRLQRPLPKHAAYTLLNYGSVSSSAFAESTRDLRAQGYSGELPELHRAVDVVSLIRLGRCRAGASAGRGSPAA